MYADIHIHLDDAYYDNDRDAVIERASAAGVKAILTTGLGPTSNRKALELAKKYRTVRAVLGIYPCDAIEEAYREEIDVDTELAFIEKNAKDIAAIGECGLDLHHGKDLSSQIPVFEKQLLLAKKLKKPVIIHSRKAEKEVFEVLAKHIGIDVVLHCFGGNRELIDEGIKRGYNFSIPPIIERSSSFKRLVTVVPLRQLLTETDGPYLAPQPETRNEPAFVEQTVKTIAVIKGITPQECMYQLFMNYQRILP